MLKLLPKELSGEKFRSLTNLQIFLISFIINGRAMRLLLMAVDLKTRWKNNMITIVTISPFLLNPQERRRPSVLSWMHQPLLLPTIQIKLWGSKRDRTFKHTIYLFYLFYLFYSYFCMSNLELRIGIWNWVRWTNWVRQKAFQFKVCSNSATVSQVLCCSRNILFSKKFDSHLTNWNYLVSNYIP